MNPLGVIYLDLKLWARSHVSLANFFWGWCILSLAVLCVLSFTHQDSATIQVVEMRAFDFAWMAVLIEIRDLLRAAVKVYSDRYSS